MKLIEIDKQLYRTRLNTVIIGFIVTLAALSLLFGTVLIHLFVENALLASEIASPEKTSNFKYNFAGVLLALLACAAILHGLKRSAYFEEIYYVWKLKQLHNLIYRKLKKIKTAALKHHDENALFILNFYYTGLKQVYTLDDNTLTLETLAKDHKVVKDILIEKNISLSSEPFSHDLLAQY